MMANEKYNLPISPKFYCFSREVQGIIEKNLHIARCLAHEG